MKLSAEQHITLGRIKLLCEGRNPWLFRVDELEDGNGVHVYLQPWGSPIHLTWRQALAFVDLPIEWPPERIQPQSSGSDILRRLVNE